MHSKKWMVRMLTLALVLTGCRAAPTAQSDSPSGGPAVQLVRELSLSERGVLSVGIDSGLHFTDFETAQTAVIPGTGADGLNLDFFNCRGPYLSGDQIFYYAVAPASVTFYRMDRRAQQRTAGPMWQVESGEILSVENILYAPPYSYLQLGIQQLNPDPKQVHHRSELWRVELDRMTSVRLDALETERPFVERLQLIGADAEQVYYQIGHVRADSPLFDADGSYETLEAAYQAALSEHQRSHTDYTQWQFLSDQTEQTLSAVPHRAAEPHPLHRADSAAYAMDLENGDLIAVDQTGVHHLDPQTGQPSVIAALHDCLMPRCVIDGRLLYDAADPITVKQMDLKTGTVSPAPFGQKDEAGNSRFLPLLSRGDWLVGSAAGEDAAGGSYARISKSDYFNGREAGLKMLSIR